MDLVLKLACVMGARPNFIKMAALIAEFRQRLSFDVRLIHTGQHFSPEMSQVFFVDLELPTPDLNLEVGAGTGTSDGRGDEAARTGIPGKSPGLAWWW